MSVTDEQIIERLRALLAESDLQTTTEKMLRGKLEEEFKMDMSDKKLMIRQEIEKYLAAQGDQDEGDEESEAGKTTGRGARGSGPECLLSEPLQKFLGEETLPRTQVVKRLWDYIKSKNLQDPKDKRRIILDDQLRTIFTPPLNMFSMNSQLSKHCKTMDAASEGSRGSKAAGEKRSNAGGDKSKAKKAKSGEGADGEEKRTNAMSQPMKASAELASLCGTDMMTRGGAIKFLWSYVKEHNLQDPADKKFVNCDAALKKLTGEDRIQGLTIPKYICQHLTKV